MQGSAFLAECKLTPGHKCVLKKVHFTSAHYDAVIVNGRRGRGTLSTGL